MALLDNQDPNKDKDNPEWTKTLPEELGKSPALAKFKPAEGEQLVSMPISVAKSYVELEKKMGDPDSLLRIPGEKATPEERDAFHVKLGRPAKQEEYEIPGEDPKNEGHKKINDRFRAVAFKHGVSKTALKELGAEMTAIVGEINAQGGPLSVANAEDILKGVWKSDFDGNLKKAEFAGTTIWGEKFDGLMKKTGLSHNPDFIKGLLDVTRYFPAETMKGIDGPGSQVPGLTREKLREMQQDPKYWDPSRRDPSFVRQVQEGYKKLFPGQILTAPTDRHQVQ